MGKGLRKCKEELTLTTRKLPSTSQAAKMISMINIVLVPFNRVDEN